MKNFRKGRKRLMDWLSLYIFILFLSSSQLLFCASDDRLTLGDSISVNQTLVSDGGAFALGFFSPSNSSNNLYIGIWYATIPLKTVIWVMNREKPLMDSFGVLKITNYSNLLIFDSKENVHWSSNVSSSSLSRNGTAAVLLNTGNFVLRQGDGTILWQSFDHPTDTFIPGMKLEYNYKTHFTQGITSWKNLLDPSPGNFSLGVDPSTSLQLFVWQGLKPYWRSSVWSGNFFSSAQLTNGDYAAYLTIFATNEDIYMTFGLTDSSAIIRYMLDSTGHIKLLSWNQSSNKWSNLWSRPLIGCDAYGLCGSFGYCDTTESVPTCKCLEGFEPKVQRDWTNGNFSGGCIREKTLDCGNGDGFLRLRGMKMPDLFVFLHNQSMSECEAACFGNCSCTAYAYANLSNGTANVSRCLVWFDELIDVEQVGSSGEDLYLRLAASELGGKRKTNILVILLPIAGVILLIACIFTVWKCKDKMKGSGKKKNKLSILNDVSSSTEFPKEFSGPSGFGEGNSGEGTELPLFTIDSIAIATNNFSDACKLGQGGFGKVYKGTLPGGQEIAVKRLSRGSGQGLQEFKNEIRLIAKLQHRNLVRLLGCCIQEEEKILLYEYMANKSLDVFLFDPTKKALLDWGKRFDIIKGIARGLLYLHQDSRLRIIHRDLKVSNILLDIEMNPKISDFGMARIFGGNQNEANTLRVVGTYGYMSPEYAMEGLFSVKSDVYSFGVLLLEIVCGLKNSSFHLTMDYPNLLSYAWKFWNEGKTMDIVDQSISQSCSSHEVRRCIHVGLLCVQHQPNDRPPMSSVVFMLENENATFLTPKQPTYTAGRNLDRNDPPMYISDAISVNNVTITQVEGR